MPVAKIFYKHLNLAQLDKMYEDARKVAGVEDVVLEEEVVREVERLLVRSTMALPTSARRFGEWSVGLLERYVEV